MSKKIPPRVLPKMDSVGRQISSYHSACDGQREANARLMRHLRDRGNGHWGEGTPLMRGYGVAL